MPDLVKIELLPLGVVLEVAPGTPLQDILFSQGVEFPCGGRGRCKGCRIKVLRGSLPVTSEDQRLLAPAEIAAGWRLSCRATAQSDLKIELAQWEATILADETRVAFAPREGLGVAIDLGTTTLVAQLLDLQTGNVLAVQTALNRQAQHGADIMSRVDYAAAGGQARLQALVREQIGKLIDHLFAGNRRGAGEVREVVLVGNTVMHHLFCGVSIEPLSHYPFDAVNDGLQVFPAKALGWDLECQVRFLPCLGGFVGSDILAGILATNLEQSDALVALIDLGTNGEIVVGNRERMLCASTAAGPAFEGARISMGMRAATGAVSEVAWHDGQFRCRVLGNVSPRGICGSGLVDAVAVALETGLIQGTGRFSSGQSLVLAPPVVLTQRDIRELQLAKGAIAAGFRILLHHWGASANDLSRVYLAGAFGNYISRASARRIGLLNFPPEKVEPAGNTALRGAKQALFALADGDGSYKSLRQKVQHCSLNEDEQFQDIYVEEMAFPD
jgi:uncharacterized 2Fe-2S/4Fe-4S cluster protein (DUF4445 family)